MRKKIEDLIVIIPAAGIGTRGYPATLEIAKELITLPFEGYLQNSIVVLIEKLVQAGISAQNIAIVISPEKTSIKSIFESKKSIIEELRSKGKHNFAEKVERVEFLAPAKFIRFRRQKLLSLLVKAILLTFFQMTTSQQLVKMNLSKSSKLTRSLVEVFCRLSKYKMMLNIRNMQL